MSILFKFGVQLLYARYFLRTYIQFKDLIIEMLHFQLNTSLFIILSRKKSSCFLRMNLRDVRTERPLLQKLNKKENTYSKVHLTIISKNIIYSVCIASIGIYENQILKNLVSIKFNALILLKQRSDPTAIGIFIRSTNAMV